MILITQKNQCCGCTACVQVCPKQCIVLREDSEGFVYPYVNTETCLNCNLCNSSCPIINQNEPREPMVTFAAKHPNDEIRKVSSSGGIFSILAEEIIAKNGVVFGARFDSNWEVEHAYAETMEKVALFRGSKYVQSRIGETYKQAEKFLKDGRLVLFTGTPCQIAGLNKYLRKEYENLLTVDVICHGVPSPLVWRTYLKEINKKNLPITSINMRDKKDGWKKFRIHIESNDGKILDEPSSSNIYLQGFFKNLYLRPSCYHCSVRNFKSSSDITIGDFWNGEKFYPLLDFQLGYSVVISSSQKGTDFIIGLNQGELIPVSTESTFASNPVLKYSVQEPILRSVFWDGFPKRGSRAIRFICNKIKPNLITRTILAFKRLFLKWIK